MGYKLACFVHPLLPHTPTIFTLSPFELLISSYNKYYRHAYIEQDNLNYLGNIRSRVCSKVQTFSLATYLGPCLTSSVEFKGCVLHEILDFGILISVTCWNMFMKYMFKFLNERSHIIRTLHNP